MNKKQPPTFCIHMHIHTHRIIALSCVSRPLTRPTFQVLHGHETAEDGAGSQGVAAPRLDGRGVGGAVTQQVDQGRVEVEDGRPHVDVVLVVLGGKGAEVILAARETHGSVRSQIKI